jgi:hypothetical protein
VIIVQNFCLHSINEYLKNQKFHRDNQKNLKQVSGSNLPHFNRETVPPIKKMLPAAAPRL